MFLLNSYSCHATALQVFNSGVLITGPSGIGKSECALELIARGHSLVADDIVFIHRTESGGLALRAKQGTGPLLNIRGIGIVDVVRIYGSQHVVPQANLNLVVELSKTGNVNDYELLGFEEKTQEILGVSVQHVVIPFSTQSGVATKIELIVKNNSLSSPYR